MIETSTGPLAVVDADSHVIEPADLWTSRVPSRFSEDVPRVEVNPATGHHHWRIGSEWIWPVGFFGTAGWDGYPPEAPWEYEDIDAGTYDPVERIKRIDEYGVDVQILYPNIIGFQSGLIEELGPELALLCTEAYNDFLLEWTSVDQKRLIPIAMLPYWDRDAAVAEMERCVNNGHRGALFANKFEKIGMPSFCDPYWDRVYAAAQEMDIPINYHIGFSSIELATSLQEETLATRRLDAQRARTMARTSTGLLVGQGDLLGTILTSGLCERFPRLNLVSVETGFGYIPFYLEALDWHWQAYGNSSELLPSEYFKRQCYGTLWFEKTTLGLLDQYAENFMFSTDYPHGTSLSPGPASPADLPSKHILDAYADIDPGVTRKVISGNAKRLYKLDV